ncbi:MAG: SPOR domain-containing protein [Prevotella sp.]
MYKVVAILILAISNMAAANAQSFVERLQKSAKGQGTVTVSHDAAIDALVNGPYVAQQAPVQKTRKPTDEKPDVATGSKPAANKPAANKPAANKEQPKNNPEKEKTEPATAPETTAENPDTRKKVMKNSYKTMGFRVQAYAGGNSRSDRQKAEQIGENIKANIPGEPVYVHFYSPRWICRVGNYRTYEEAHQMLLAIRKLGYTQASIVKGKISVQY